MSFAALVPAPYTMKSGCFCGSIDRNGPVTCRGTARCVASPPHGGPRTARVRPPHHQLGGRRVCGPSVANKRGQGCGLYFSGAISARGRECQTQLDQGASEASPDDRCQFPSLVAPEHAHRRRLREHGLDLLQRLREKFHRRQGHRASASGIRYQVSGIRYQVADQKKKTGAIRSSGSAPQF